MWPFELIATPVEEPLTAFDLADLRVGGALKWKKTRDSPSLTARFHRPQNSRGLLAAIGLLNIAPISIPKAKLQAGVGLASVVDSELAERTHPIILMHPSMRKPNVPNTVNATISEWMKNAREKGLIVAQMSGEGMASERRTKGQNCARGRERMQRRRVEAHIIED